MGGPQLTVSDALKQHSLMFMPVKSVTILRLSAVAFSLGNSGVFVYGHSRNCRANVVKLTSENVFSRIISKLIHEKQIVFLVNLS